MNADSICRALVLLFVYMGGPVEVTKKCRGCGEAAPHGTRFVKKRGKRMTADLCRDCYNARGRARSKGWKRKPTNLTWKAWYSMRQRAGKAKWYEHTTVCVAWDDPETGYAAFLRDMGERPDGMSLDRADSSGGYSPDNCRWATMTTQQRNKRNNLKVTWRGKTKLLVEWAEELGIPYQTLYGRIYRRGWSVGRAFGE